MRCRFTRRLRPTQPRTYARCGPAQQAEPSQPQRRAGGTDRVELSTAARELLEATQAAGAAEADRAELVLRIRQQIAEGSYQPDAEAVAKALLEQLEGPAQT